MMMVKGERERMDHGYGTRLDGYMYMASIVSSSIVFFLFAASKKGGERRDEAVVEKGPVGCI
jgi:hypothetical protein